MCQINFIWSKIDGLMILYTVLPESQLNMSVTSKLTLLNNFLSEFEHLPAQGTIEWKEQRMNRIGGSEVSSVLKQNKNKNVNKLVMEKLNFDPFTGNVVTHWGNVFEELIRLFTERTFNCSIAETGSIPYHKGYLSYSPDGISVVSSQALSKFMNLKSMNLSPTDKDHLTLFEFKCPHSRIPDHSIPDHYRPQIDIGMNIIDIMEVGIFIQAVYRRCTFDDIAYNTMHNGFGHYKRAIMDGFPKETGFMVMYCSDFDYTKDLVEYLNNDYRTKSIDGVIDIGSIYDADAFEEIMKECVSKRITIDYSFCEQYSERVFQADGMTQAFYNISLRHRAMTALHKACERYGNSLIGIMPYKLLNVYITPVVKDHEYIENTNILAKAKKVIDCINDHRALGLTSKAEVAKSVRAYKL